MQTEIQLQSLRERVARLEAELRFIYVHLGVTYKSTFNLDPADKEVAEHLKKGDEMKAITAYRSVHTVGFNEAKAAVAEIRIGLGLGF